MTDGIVGRLCHCHEETTSWVGRVLAVEIGYRWRLLVEDSTGRLFTRTSANVRLFPPWEKIPLSAGPLTAEHQN